MKRLIFLMLCMLPWLVYSQNEQTPQEQLVYLMKNYYHSDINNIQALLDAGASFDVKDKYGRTPIFYLHSPLWYLIELINKYSINLTIRDHDGYTVYEYLLRNSGILEFHSRYDSGYCLEFMNFMEQQYAPYNVNKMLFPGWNYKWEIKYSGKTISQIRAIVEKRYQEDQVWWRKLEEWVSNEGLGLVVSVFLGIFKFFGTTLTWIAWLSRVILLVILVWFVFSGRLGRLISRIVPEIIKFTDTQKHNNKDTKKEAGDNNRSQ
jgi:hypothetical protein